MPGSTSSLPRPEVVARLRAAGCVFAEDEAGLLIAAARNPAELARLVDQRAAGMPLEQVLGWAEFCGLRIAVEPGVFAPRRRTEFLAGQAIALACRDRASLPPVVVDLCCGSGAVAAAGSEDARLHRDAQPAEFRPAQHLLKRHPGGPLIHQAGQLGRVPGRRAEQSGLVLSEHATGRPEPGHDLRPRQR